MKTAVHLHIKGVVQGVGFRPFVYREAKKNLISGWVINAVDGVHVEAEGEEANVNSFVMSLSDNAPQASTVTEINIEEIPLQNFQTFEIRKSDGNETNENTLVSPDIGICVDCARELFDKNNKRYHYPFINCTNCGPRFTIIEDLPYDRKTTSMKEFEMCDFCSSEFENPDNRRFHAQPNACFDCGPHVYLDDFNNKCVGINKEVSDEIFRTCAQMLGEGKILAVKGLGGYHLVCDALNEDALVSLRKRKQRDNKPFAVMMQQISEVKKYCYVSKDEEVLLKSAERPIVLLKKKEKKELPSELCGDLPELGTMLPCTPVQALLMEAFIEVSQRCDHMLVMTSGNLHDDPIVIDGREAKQKFRGIADAILGNNRKILTRFDDSVVRVLNLDEEQTAFQMIRRARGYAPKPLCITTSYKQILFATGPEQKNTFCYVKGNKAFVSQHIGDVENAEVSNAWHEIKQRYENLFDLNDINDIVCDKHPEYLTSKWAFNHVRDTKDTIGFDEVYHHHAHIASAMAENGIEGPAVGFSFDGTGFGADGCIWGGEVLLCNLETFERVANLSYFPLPGARAAIKNPTRCAYGLLYSLDLLSEATSFVERMGDDASTCASLIEEGINTPYTSSVGRLFDAVSALLGVCEIATYEGEPATELEACMFSKNFQHYTPDEARYVFEVEKNTATKHSTALDTSMFVIDPIKVIKAIIEDVASGIAKHVISRRFHDSIVRLVTLVSQITHELYGIKKIVLSGGVWMNRYLIENSVTSLQNAGFDVILNRELPPNDGGVSYGQACVRCARIKKLRK